MTDATTPAARDDVFVQEMTELMSRLARSLSESAQAEPRALQELEEQVVRVLHDFGNHLLAASLPLTAPERPAPDLAPVERQPVISANVQPALPPYLVA